MKENKESKLKRFFADKMTIGMGIFTVFPWGFLCGIHWNDDPYAKWLFMGWLVIVIASYIQRWVSL